MLSACPECDSVVESSAVWRGGCCSHSRPCAWGLPVASCAESSAGKCSFWSLNLSMLRLIFGLLCVIFPITLLCYFRTIHQLSLGDLGIGSPECSSTTISSFTAVHLFSLPFLLYLFWLKISLNAEGHMTSGVSNKKYFRSTNLCWLAFFYIVWLLRFKMWFD